MLNYFGHCKIKATPSHCLSVIWSSFQHYQHWHVRILAISSFLEVVYDVSIPTVNAIVKDDDDGVLTWPSRLKMSDLLAAFPLFFVCPTDQTELPRRGVSQEWKVGKARLSISLCWQKMRRKSVTKVLLGHFQAYFFLCLLYLCFVFKGLKSYYIFCRKHYYVAISMQLWYYTQYTIFLYRCMRYLCDSETI